jgi:hypothetical protein
VDAFSAETPISVMKTIPRQNTTLSRRGERRGEERRERGGQSDAYARHGLKRKKVRVCVVMDPIWQ